MSGENIAFCFILWLIIGAIAAGAFGVDGDDRASAIAFFWPVTLPIIFIFGFFYVIWEAMKIGLSLFRSNK